jgi:hypothetical protein
LFSGLNMTVIGLNRRFHEWNEKEAADPELRRAMGLDDGAVGWDELLAKKRIVILAEAGSGKSTELRERARFMAESRPYVFSANVEDLGRDGLDQAIGPVGRRQLEKWRNGTDEAWFFIDSVDEAKASGIKFEAAVRKTADGIYGAEDRCHIVFSSRFTDWEARRDLTVLNKWLSAPAGAPQVSPTADEELRRIIRNQASKPSPPAVEPPFIAVMIPLDQERARIFAREMDTPRLDAFLEAIEKGDLWHFAHRPLDLGWLVDFWKVEGRLGSLQEMIERSISERLRESNLDRARHDAVRDLQALQAVERIGASMVFGRRYTIAIPDGESGLSTDSLLDLTEMLPDWSGDERSRLLTRAVFDPGTLGRVRLHNDNQGVIRSYLAARWLWRLRQANLPQATLFRLLFARSYDLEVVRPSLQQSAAWLALWDKEVANEVVRLAPDLLLVEGDPASLPTDVRKATLIAVLDGLGSGSGESPFWSNDMLRRFAQPDLANVVQSSWPQYCRSEKAAELLMRLAWLGGFKNCVQFAQKVVYDGTRPLIVRSLAAKVVLARGDKASRETYASFIKAEAPRLPIMMVRDALLELFPTLISVRDMLGILSAVKIEDDQNGLRFEWEGPDLVERLDQTPDVEELLSGLLALLGTKLRDHAYDQPTKREEILFPAMAAAARRLLLLSPADSAPDVAVDAILRILNRSEDSDDVRKKANEALGELHRTAGRRQQAFWQVVSTLRAEFPSKAFDRALQIWPHGYSGGFQEEDIDWLLADGLKKGRADCRLAVEATVAIWQATGSQALLLEKIEAAVKSDATALKVFRESTQPGVPFLYNQQLQRRIDADVEKNRRERAEQEQRWVDRIQAICADRQRLGNLSSANDAGRSDLTTLFGILRGATRSSRYAIDSVAPLERILGAEVAKAVRGGLIGYWRSHQSALRSKKKLEEYNTVSWADLMGLAGVTLEAKDNPAWAAKITGVDARRATEYAMVEINGFPGWLLDLVLSHPAEVASVLHSEITHEIQTGDARLETLREVARSTADLARLLSATLLQELQSNTIPADALLPVLQILVKGLQDADKPAFIRLAVSRFECETVIGRAIQYLAAVFHVVPGGAAAALAARVGALSIQDHTKLMDEFLLTCFGNSIVSSAFGTVEVPPDVLEELALLSLETYDQVAGRERPAGIVYQVSNTDHADHARSAIFNRFVNTPGAATYSTLRRLQGESNFPVSSERLRELAEQRATADSESDPWPLSEAHAFEQGYETQPQTGKDLLAVLIGRLEDMQHDLVHGDFSQGRTLKKLASEQDVQNWIAQRLRDKQGRSFSVVREPHVAAEKEPDMMIRAKATDASVAVEIKVADSWTLDELQKALESQLCGQYLRSTDSRHGVLLLVHKKKRRWKNTVTNKFLSFPQVVLLLQERARHIAAQKHDSSQPEVAALDVSAC